MEAVALGILASAGWIATMPERSQAVTQQNMKNMQNSNLNRAQQNQAKTIPVALDNGNVSNQGFLSAAAMRALEPSVYPRYTAHPANKNDKYWGHKTTAISAEAKTDPHLQRMTGFLPKISKREVASFQAAANANEPNPFLQQRDINDNLRRRGLEGFSDRRDGERLFQPVTDNARLPAGTADRIVPPHTLHNRESSLLKNGGGRDVGHSKGNESLHRAVLTDNEYIRAQGGVRDVGPSTHDLQQNDRHFSSEHGTRVQGIETTLKASSLTSRDNFENVGWRRREAFDDDGVVITNRTQGADRLQVGHATDTQSKATLSAMREQGAYHPGGRRGFVKPGDFENEQATKTRAARQSELGGNFLNSAYSSRVQAGALPVSNATDTLGMQQQDILQNKSDMFMQTATSHNAKVAHEYKFDRSKTIGKVSDATVARTNDRRTLRAELDSRWT